MFKAASKGATNKVIACIEKGDDINSLEVNTGRTLLHFAVENENVELVEYLVGKKEKGIQVDTKDFEGDSPLMIAVKGMNVEIMEILLRAGASIDTRDNDDMTVLHAAASQNAVNIIHKLKHFNFDFNSTNSSGTALHIAINNGSVESAMEIIGRKDFDFTLCDSNGNNSLFKSVNCIYPEIFLEIINKVEGLTEEKRKDLVKMRNKRGNTILHEAALHKKVNITSLLLKKADLLGLDINAKNNEGLLANEILKKEEEKFFQEQAAQEAIKKEKLEKNKMNQEIKRRKEKEIRQAAYQEEVENTEKEKIATQELEKVSKVGPYIFFTAFAILFVGMYFVFKFGSQNKRKEIIL